MSLPSSKRKLHRKLIFVNLFIFHRSSSSLPPLLLSIVKGKQEYIEIKIEINDNSRSSLSLVWLTKLSLWYGWVSAKKQVMKVLSHTFLERAFCPHSYRWKPHLLRETNFPVQRDFNSQSTTIPLNLHYMWPAGRGENNSKVRHKTIHNSLICNASKAYQWVFCVMDCGHSLTTSACQKHMQNLITFRESWTIHSAFLFCGGSAVPTHKLRRVFFPWDRRRDRGSWFQLLQGISKVCYIDCA